MYYLLNSTYLGVMGLIVLKDMQKGKIPNVLLTVLLAINVLFVETLFLSSAGSSLVSGEMLQRFCGAALVLLFLFPFFAIGALGAGDVKLLAVCALREDNLLTFLGLVFVAGAVIGVIKLIVKMGPKSCLEKLSLCVRTAVTERSFLPLVPAGISDPGKRKLCVHLSLPIFLVTVLSVMNV